MMIRTMVAAATLLLLSGCGTDDRAPSAERESEAASPAAEAPAGVPELAGQWTVATIDGRPVSGGSAMAASFQGGSATISAGCLRRAWTYTQKKNVVAFATAPGGSSNCEGRSPSAEQEAAYVALEKATMAIFGKDGATASLSGTGGNLGLERR